MKNTIAIILSGICIGILLGLSRSEVLGSVLVPIITVIMSLVSLLVGLKLSSKEGENQSTKIQITNINALPIMWLFISILIGTVPGMLIRNYNLLSPKENVEPVEETHNGHKNSLPKDNLTGLYNFTPQVCQDYHLCEINGWEFICQLVKIESPTIDKILNSNEINIQDIEKQIKRECKCE